MSPHYFSPAERSTWERSLVLADYGPTTLWLHLDKNGNGTLERRDNGTMGADAYMRISSDELQQIRKCTAPTVMELDPVPFHDHDGAHGHATCPYCGHQVELDRGAEDKVAVISCPNCRERYAVVVPGTPYHGEI